MNSGMHQSGWKPAFMLLCMAALVRFASLGLYPLMDTSEARYAEIARKMAASGDWITPWFDPGVPFWGKPPLSFWLDAASFHVLGVSEFAARLPHWLMAMGIILLLWKRLAREFDRRVAAIACTLLMASALFFVTAGAVLTDVALAFGAVLVMCGFRKGMNAEPGRDVPASLMVFGGLAIGLLAKGPLILVIAGVPLGAWTLWQKKIRSAWQQFPWVAGTLLTLLVVAPWYVAAEIKTPGFIEYFLVGEHWQRFVVPGWAGDRYGTAHDYPRGQVWIFLAQACFPWMLLLPLVAVKERLRPSRAAPAPKIDSALRGYLLLWGLWPAVFFSFAGNVLWTYVLPGMPALAALCGIWLSRVPSPRIARATLAVGTFGIIVLFVALLGYLQFNAMTHAKTAKFLVQHYEKIRSDDEPLIYLGRRPFSAEFYSRNSALLATDAASVARILNAHGGSGYIAMNNSHDSTDLERHFGTLDCVTSFRNTQLCRVTAPPAVPATISISSNPD